MNPFSRQLPLPFRAPSLPPQRLVRAAAGRTEGAPRGLRAGVLTPLPAATDPSARLARASLILGT